MIHLRDATLRCNVFGCPGYYDYIKAHDMYQCPVCGWEEWGEEAHGQVTTADAKWVFRLQLRYVDTIRKHGGGTKQAGRKRKDRRRRVQLEGVMPYFRDY